MFKSFLDPQPVWNAINNFHPDLFIFLGDNVYADTKDPFRLRQAWQRLGHQSGYLKLKQQSIICAIWDDHDYGKNDAGKEFPIRKESQQIFLDFLMNQVIQQEELRLESILKKLLDLSVPDCN